MYQNVNLKKKSGISIKMKTNFMKEGLQYSWAGIKLGGRML